MKAIIFSREFIPDQELLDFCEKELKLDISNIDWSDNNIRFNSEIIKFCEERLTPLWGEEVYKGKETYERKCGFYGAGYIREVDTSRNWRIVLNNVDAPEIKYVRIVADEYGEIFTSSNMHKMQKLTRDKSKMYIGEKL